MKYQGKLDGDTKLALMDEATKRYPLDDMDVPKNNHAKIYLILFSVVVTILFLIPTINELKNPFPDASNLIVFGVFWGCFELAALILFFNDLIKKNGYKDGMVMKGIVIRTWYSRGTKMAVAVYYDYLREQYCASMLQDDGISVGMRYAKAGSGINLVVKEKGNKLKVVGSK